MYNAFKSHLTKELQDIKDAGLYKNERLITTPQKAGINVAGTEGEVLFEQPYDNEHIEGLISNYQRVIVKAPVSLCGEIAKVKITGIQEDFLVGELV